MYEYEELEQYTLIKAPNGHLAIKRCKSYRRPEETWAQAQARLPVPEYANLRELIDEYKNEFIQTFKNQPPGQYPMAGHFFDQIRYNYDYDYGGDYDNEDEPYYYDDDWGSH